MTKDEARQFLEDHDYCLIHFQKRVKLPNSRKTDCSDCIAEKQRAEELQAEAAIRVLRGQGPAFLPSADFREWIPYHKQLPPHQLRVYMVCVGFVESKNRAGGRELVTTGKPIFWMRKPF